MDRCDLYPTHLIAVSDDHHVCPAEWFRAAGRPVTSPTIHICPTCHRNAHAQIDAQIRGQPLPFGPRSRIAPLAHQAFDLAAGYGLTPKPTL